jgi:hypothetical protein
VSKFIEGKDKVKDAKRGTATCLVIGTGVKIAGMDAKEGTDTSCQYLEQRLKASEPVQVMILLSKWFAHPRLQNGLIAYLGNHSANYLVPLIPNLQTALVNLLSGTPWKAWSLHCVIE